MNDLNSFEEAINIVRSSPLLSSGQKSLYISRLRRVSSAERQKVIAFLQNKNAEFESKLREISAKTAFWWISSFVSKRQKTK